jgi:hypothetical protein
MATVIVYFSACKSGHDFCLKGDYLVKATSCHGIVWFSTTRRLVLLQMMLFLIFCSDFFLYFFIFGLICLKLEMLKQKTWPFS